MPQPESPQTNSLGLKAFNQTGRNDTTTEVLRPKTDPALARRNAMLIGVVIVAFIISAYFVFLRSGLDLNTITKDPGQGFGATHEQNMDKSDKQ